MRHINYDPSKLKLPDGWAEKAAELEQQLLTETDAEKRKKIIDDNSNMWSQIKPLLAKLFNNKCWYTEAPQYGTDVDVDHFRPKKRLIENSEHSGYWWLAFKLENYRYSCIYANRSRRDIETGVVGGKVDHFPLIDESKRAKTPDCDCNEEQPVLLDPCKLSDVKLLTFKDDGEAMPRYSETEKRKYMRAYESIKYYSLNLTEFVKARLALRDQLSKEIQNAQRYFKKLETGDSTHEHAYEQSICKIKEMCSEESQYSSFCLAFVEKYRHEDFLEGVF